MTDPAPSGNLAVGVDIGATKLATVLVNPWGAVVRRERTTLEPLGTPATVVQEVARHLASLVGTDRLEVSSVGVGVAAQVRRTTGEVVFAPNLRWRDVPLGPMLSKELGRPVIVVNDVRAATYAEWQFGAGAGARDLALVQVGTGVGGGIVSGGQLLLGASNTAGELGHLTIVSGGRPCSCGGRGCLEAYVGGLALGTRAREAYADEPSRGTGLRAAAGGTDHLDARAVGRAYRFHDPLSVDLVNETAEYLASGIVSVVNAVNPEVVVLAGGVIDGIPELIPLVEHRVKAAALAAATGGLRVVAGTLGEVAGAIGAAGLSRPGAPL